MIKIEPKRDLRVTKTYNALFSALRSLLEEKKFEDITVNELCERALVRRATFYKHFTDKYDFLACMLKEMHQTYLSQAERYNDPEDPCAYYIGLIRSAFDFVEKNTINFEKALVSSNVFNILTNLGSDEITSYLTDHLRRDQDAGYSFPAQPELLAQLLAGAMLQSTRWWYVNKEQISKESVIEQLSAMMRRFYTLCAGSGQEEAESGQNEKDSKKNPSAPSTKHRDCVRAEQKDL